MACATTGAVPVPVLPDERAILTTAIDGLQMPDGTIVPSARHLYPFSLPFLAVCMARVLERKPSSHPGDLDSGTQYACMIVIMFFSFYRGVSADEFLDAMDVNLNRQGTLEMAPVQLPFFEESASLELPADLRGVLVEALQLQVSTCGDLLQFVSV